jgi:hypothetical protein
MQYPQLGFVGPEDWIATTGQLALQADKLGPDRLALLVEPVGVDEPRGVIVRGGPDGGEERGGVGH